MSSLELKVAPSKSLRPWRRPGASAQNRAPGVALLLRASEESVVKAIVVYESHWGNTQTIARAIAEGFGDGAAALSTSEATPSVVAEAELVVAGAPVMAFRLPSNRTLESISMNPGKAPAPPDLSHPPMRAWLDGLPAGNGRAASFETRLRWSPGGSTSAIDSAFQRAGYRLLATAQRFVVRGSYGPLRDGEVERARTWGAELAKAMS